MSNAICQGQSIFKYRKSEFEKKRWPQKTFFPFNPFIGFSNARDLKRSLSRFYWLWFEEEEEMAAERDSERFRNFRIHIDICRSFFLFRLVALVSAAAAAAAMRYD